MYTVHFGPMVSNSSLDTRHEATVGYAPRLGTFSGTMLVVGGIIGAGIFLSPAVVAQRVGSASLTLAAWGIGAVVAIIGGFIYAELGARRPRAGGTYVYLREAWGPLPAFLYGWALFLMIGTGAIAAVAMTGAGYIASLLGWSGSTISPLAIAIVAVLTVLNIMGVQVGATTGNILTVLKLSAIAMLVLVVLMLTPQHVLPASTVTAAALARPTGSIATIVAMGAGAGAGVVLVRRLAADQRRGGRVDQSDADPAAGINRRRIDRVCDVFVNQSRIFAGARCRGVGRQSRASG